MSTFFAVYLLQSVKPRADGKINGKTYIGCTVNPKRRLRQHNGEITMGAKKTSRHMIIYKGAVAILESRSRPWEMVLVCHGFPTLSDALQFEWAWQHPHRSIAVRDAAALLPTRGQQTVRGKVHLLVEMLRVEKWNQTPLQVQFLSSKHQVHLCGTPPFPSCMRQSVGAVEDLPINCAEGFDITTEADSAAAAGSDRLDCDNPAATADTASSAAKPRRKGGARHQSAARAKPRTASVAVGSKASVAGRGLDTTTADVVTDAGQSARTWRGRRQLIAACDHVLQARIIDAAALGPPKSGRPSKQVLASTSALDAAQTAADTARLLPEEAELAASRAEAAVDVALSLAGSKRPGKELSALRSAACMARHHAAQSALAAADDAAASIAASRLDTAEQAVDSATLTYREAVAASGPTSVAAQAAQEQLAVCQQQAGEACRAVAALPSTMLQDDRDSALACGCTIEMQRTSSAAKLPNAPAAPPKSSPSHQHVLQVGIADDPGDQALQHQQAVPACRSMPASPILISSDSEEESSSEGCAPEQQQQQRQQLMSTPDFVLHSKQWTAEQQSPPTESPSPPDWPLPCASTIVCISVSSDSDQESDRSPGGVNDLGSSTMDDVMSPHCTPQRPQSRGAIQRSPSSCSMQLGTPVATVSKQQQCDERAVEVISLVTPA